MKLVGEIAVGKRVMGVKQPWSASAQSLMEDSFLEQRQEKEGGFLTEQAKITHGRDFDVMVFPAIVVCQGSVFFHEVEREWGDFPWMHDGDVKPFR